MKFSTEYGYLIKAIQEYPFTEKIKDRIEQIENPLRRTDINSGIKAQNKTQDPKVLLDLIKKESDPVLHKYELYKKAIELVKDKMLPEDWEIIRQAYILKSMTVEGAGAKYLYYGKTQSYNKVVKPFFMEVERTIFEISASKKFSFKVSVK